MSRLEISEALQQLIVENSFSSEELNDLMQRITEELEQETINIIASWENESQNSR